LLALPWNTRSTLTHSPLLALALTRASRPRKKMNSRHNKTGDDHLGDNSPVCWPLIETEKQLRQQVTEEHWATNRPRTLGANLHVLASRHDPQVPLGVVVSPLLAERCGLSYADRAPRTPPPPMTRTTQQLAAEPSRARTAPDLWMRLCTSTTRHFWSNSAGLRTFTHPRRAHTLMTDSSTPGTHPWRDTHAHVKIIANSPCI